MTPFDAKTLGRREALRVLGAGAAALPFLAACGDTGSMSGVDGGTSSGLDAATGTDAATTGTDAGSADEWASGGTASMADPTSYPDPFETIEAASCAFYAQSTLGPCYYTTPVRQDISEGYPGLPMSLRLRVMNESCEPIEGARVEIWHTRNSGLYSGGPSGMCTDNDADALANLYFRGGQVTDTEGKVTFATCMPGWYSSRAVHIHFQVFLADGSTATSISQLFFQPDLLTEVFSSHPEYSEFGQPDTSNARDNIYPGVGDSGLLEYARMGDGAMLSWKDIIIRS